jgi:mannose-6-phosphate isomerase-like protein (cupin superfamily)
MSDVQVKKLDEVPYYTGANSIPGIRFHSAGRELGITAWGMNVLEIDAGCTGYPEHDHIKDGQEEVYVVLQGDGMLDTGDEQIAVSTGILVRVGPSQRRKFIPGERGIVVLAIGGTPGKAYPTR